MKEQNNNGPKKLDADALIDILSGISDETANLQLPDHYLRDYYRNEQERIILIDDEIGEDTLSIVHKILYYNKLDKGLPVEERRPIRIFIDSPGGSVAVMWSVIKVIKLSKTPVYTINYCNAMSAAAHILAAGKKRYAFPGSTVLIHSGSCSYGGTVEQVESSKKYYDAMSKAANEQLLADTKIPESRLKKKASFDWYLTAEEALEQGVVDKIIDDLDEII